MVHGWAVPSVPGEVGSQAHLRALLLAVAIVLILMVPVSTAVPYLQQGFDAARTGATTDPGPAVLEEAFTIELNGSSQSGAPPLVIGGSVYALVGGEDQTEPSALYRVDLATATPHQISNLTTRSSSLASDGQHLLVAEGEQAAAYTLEGEGPIWTWEYPDVLSQEPGLGESYVCIPGAVHEGTYHLACTQGPIDDAASFTFEGVGADDASPGTRTFVAALDPATGEERWVWTAPDPGVPGGPGDLDPDPSSAARYLAVAGGTALLMTGESPANSQDEQAQARLWAVDRETGDDRWQKVWQVEIDQSVSLTGATGADAKAGAPSILATSEASYVNTGGHLEALDPTTGATIFTKNLPQRDGAWSGVGGFDMALRGEDLFLASVDRLLKLDLAVNTFDWGTELPNGDWKGSTGLLVTEGAVLGHNLASDTVRQYRAFSPEDGELVWQRSVPHSQDTRHRMGHAVGEGVLAVLTNTGQADADGQGQLTVIGTTPASIQPRAEASDLYPAVEAPVRVDLSGTQPGVLGNQTEFSVAWGDGRTSPWQASPVFEHAYGSQGDHTAVFRASNEAGQTARTEVTFHVGQDPPPEPNLVETAFQRENQDLTFGLLGIAVALSGGVIAVARRRRKRGRLEEELATIERTYEANEGKPRACEAALAERRTHVQGLLLDGKLEEGQAQILEARIDELSRQVRVGLLDERFQFLPHGLVLALRDMLDDGMITAWEREHVMSALEEDETLTDEQRERVRELVDGWFSRDTATG